MFFSCFSILAILSIATCLPAYNRKEQMILNKLGKPYGFTYDDMVAYLTRYHYMGPRSPSKKIRHLSSTDPDAAFTFAVGLFQKFNNLRVTDGVMNKETLILMSKPRCGHPDITNIYQVYKPRSWARGRLRKSGQIPWPKKKRDLLYKIPKAGGKPPPIKKTLEKHSEYYPGFTASSFVDLTRRQIRNAYQRAFQNWAGISPFSFDRSRNNNFDIKLVFNKQNHYWPCDGDKNHDGPFSEFAHASYPICGSKSYIHFDDSEIWTKTPLWRNLFAVTVHEIGHVLGLEHINIDGAVMNAFYSWQANFKFHEVDREALKALYPDG